MKIQWGRVLCCTLAGLLLQVCVLSGAGRDQAKEAQIVEQLKQSHPESVGTFVAATAAYDKEDYETAVALYRSIATAAPEFDPALRRLGASLVQVGERAAGLEYCRKAVALNRSAANLGTLAHALGVRFKDTPPVRDREEALKILIEAKALPDGDDYSTNALLAQIALELDKRAEFSAAVAILKQQHEGEMGTHYFAAIGHAMDEQWIRAEREIRRAHELGLAAETTQAFLDSGVGTRALIWKIALGCGFLIGGWLAGLAALFTIGFILSKTTLASAEKADRTLPASPSELRLRQIYRCVLNVAGIYYYISLPVVLLIVVATCAGIILGFFMIGWVPIKLTVILAIGALVTIGTMVRSLLLKPSDEETGRVVTPEEAPELWALAREVAADVGTRSIDEIRLTPGTELAVYERGNWRTKMRDQGERVLLLGMGVLNGFKLDAFKGVLAHEYGHFSNRDTAGGEVALRVRRDMMKFYMAMCEAGQATRMNMAFHFLRVYHFIFRRISHGATRLQEILADRVAAQVYGPTALESGLRHVIRRGLEFDAHANKEIERVIKAGEPLLNLYSSEMSAVEVGKEFEATFNRRTTDDDTHPSPVDRVRLVAGIIARKPSSCSDEVWGLFGNREVLTQTMLAQVEKQISGYRK